MSLVKYTIITPTGDRHKAFELCKKYVLRQTMQPTQWIVVDDGKVPLSTELPDYCIYVRREPKIGDPAHTITVNMLEAVPLITTDYVFIFEDDDWYHADYVSTLIPFFNENDIIGNRPTIHYNLEHTHYKIINSNPNKTCLCLTGFNKNIYGIFKQCCEEVNRCCIDINLWKYSEAKHKTQIRYSALPAIHVGFKGLSGRAGAMGMHYKACTPNANGFVKDTNYTQLKQWIGEEDFKEYERLFIK